METFRGQNYTFWVEFFPSSLSPLLLCEMCGCRLQQLIWQLILDVYDARPSFP